MLNIALLGASGSIGTQTLDVCRKHADKVKLVAIAVKSSLAFAIACAHEFDLAYVVIAESELEKSVAADAFPEHTRVLFGTEHLSELCELDEVDCVVNALVGAVGISAGHAALACGKRLAYANKESIVIGGERGARRVIEPDEGVEAGAAGVDDEALAGGGGDGVEVEVAGGVAGFIRSGGIATLRRAPAASVRPGPSERIVAALAGYAVKGAAA